MSIFDLFSKNLILLSFKFILGAVKVSSYLIHQSIKIVKLASNLQITSIALDQNPVYDKD